VVVGGGDFDCYSFNSTLEGDWSCFRPPYEFFDDQTGGGTTGFDRTICGTTFLPRLNSPSLFNGSSISGTQLVFLKYNVLMSTLLVSTRAPNKNRGESATRRRTHG
jgi:hypothetical protein